MSQSGSILLEWGISHFLSLFDWDSVLNERKLIYFIYFGWSFSQKCLKIHGIDFKKVSLKERLQLSGRLKKRIPCLQSLQMILMVGRHVAITLTLQLLWNGGGS